MFQGAKVLVATALDEGSDEAVLQAHAWAKATGGGLAVCHIVPNVFHNNMLFPQTVQQEALQLVETQRRAEELMIQQVTRLTGTGKDDGEPFTVAVDNGSPDAGIVQQGEQLEAGLLVMGAGGRQGVKEALLGSVTDRVIRYAHCPVLVARPQPKSKRILVATDFSERALGAVEAGAEAARLLGARLTLLHCIDIEPSRLVALGVPFGATTVVVPPEVLQEVNRNAGQTLQTLVDRKGIEGDWRVEDGNAAERIVAVARELAADLVVMGTSGRTGLSRLALGSTAEEVAARAPCSVLVIRP